MAVATISDLHHGTLKNGRVVTLVPFQTKSDAPDWVIEKLYKLLNNVIKDGKTYPIEEELNRQEFEDYYCPNFIAVLFDGDIKSSSMEDLKGHGVIGSFYIKPNYVGRSSHACNAGFLVNHEYRGGGAGEFMGRQYLIWAPQLGYKSSVFNLVYESNVASVKIWDKLGFQRIGRVPQVGRLEGSEQLVDAIMFGYKFSD